jgi:hypothetical protein
MPSPRQNVDREATLAVDRKPIVRAPGSATGVLRPPRVNDQASGAASLHFGFISSPHLFRHIRVLLQDMLGHKINYFIHDLDGSGQSLGLLEAGGTERRWAVPPRQADGRLKAAGYGDGDRCGALAAGLWMYAPLSGNQVARCATPFVKFTTLPGRCDDSPKAKCVLAQASILRV